MTFPWNMIPLGLRIFRMKILPFILILDYFLVLETHQLYSRIILGSVSREAFAVLGLQTLGLTVRQAPYLPYYLFCPLF